MEWKERKEGLERKVEWIGKKSIMDWTERKNWLERKEGLKSTKVWVAYERKDVMEIKQGWEGKKERMC